MSNADTPEQDRRDKKAEEIRSALEDFVSDFEGDFVLHGEIVDHPEEYWCPLRDLYERAKKALEDN